MGFASQFAPLLVLLLLSFIYSGAYAKHQIEACGVRTQFSAPGFMFQTRQCSRAQKSDKDVCAVAVSCGSEDGIVEFYGDVGNFRVRLDGKTHTLLTAIGLQSSSRMRGQEKISIQTSSLAIEYESQSKTYHVRCARTGSDVFVNVKRNPMSRFTVFEASMAEQMAFNADSRQTSDLLFSRPCTGVF